jgi:hypothetical protein
LAAQIGCVVANATILDFGRSRERQGETLTRLRRGRPPQSGPDVGLCQPLVFFLLVLDVLPNCFFVASISSRDEYSQVCESSLGTQCNNLKYQINNCEISLAEKGLDLGKGPKKGPERFEIARCRAEIVTCVAPFERFFRKPCN